LTIEQINQEITEQNNLIDILALNIKHLNKFKNWSYEDTLIPTKYLLIHYKGLSL
jgi:uncharacterized coiled-coil protein SlyX